MDALLQTPDNADAGGLPSNSVVTKSHEHPSVGSLATRSLHPRADSCCTSDDDPISSVARQLLNDSRAGNASSEATCETVLSASASTPRGESAIDFAAGNFCAGTPMPTAVCGEDISKARNKVTKAAPKKKVGDNVSSLMMMSKFLGRPVVAAPPASENKHTTALETGPVNKRSSCPALVACASAEQTPDTLGAPVPKVCTEADSASLKHAGPQSCNPADLPLTVGVRAGKDVVGAEMAIQQKNRNDAGSSAEVAHVKVVKRASKKKVPATASAAGDDASSAIVRRESAQEVTDLCDVDSVAATPGVSSVEHPPMRVLPTESKAAWGSLFKKPVKPVLPVAAMPTLGNAGSASGDIIMLDTPGVSLDLSVGSGFEPLPAVTLRRPTGAPAPGTSVRWGNIFGIKMASGPVQRRAPAGALRDAACVSRSFGESWHLPAFPGLGSSHFGRESGTGRDDQDRAAMANELAKSAKGSVLPGFIGELQLGTLFPALMCTSAPVTEEEAQVPAVTLRPSALTAGEVDCAMDSPGWQLAALHLASHLLVEDGAAVTAALSGLVGECSLPYTASETKDVLRRAVLRACAVEESGSVRPAKNGQPQSVYSVSLMLEGMGSGGPGVASSCSGPFDATWPWKYRPRQAEEVCGNRTSTLRLRRYLEDWRQAAALPEDEFMRLKAAQAEAAALAATQAANKAKAAAKLLLKRSGRKAAVDDGLEDDGDDQSHVGSDFFDDGDGLHSVDAQSDIEETDEEDVFNLKDVRSGGLDVPQRATRRRASGGSSVGSGRDTLHGHLLNIAIVSGPSGSGKTAAIYACAEELGYAVLEVHPGQARDKTTLMTMLREATQSRRVRLTAGATGLFASSCGPATSPSASTTVETSSLPLSEMPNTNAVAMWLAGGPAAPDQTVQTKPGGHRRRVIDSDDEDAAPDAAHDTGATFVEAIVPQEDINVKRRKLAQSAPPAPDRAGRRGRAAVHYVDDSGEESEGIAFDSDDDLGATRKEASQKKGVQKKEEEAGSKCRVRGKGGRRKSAGAPVDAEMPGATVPTPVPTPAPRTLFSFGVSSVKAAPNKTEEGSALAAAAVASKASAKGKSALKTQAKGGAPQTSIMNMFSIKVSAPSCEARDASTQRDVDTSTMNLVSPGGSVDDCIVVGDSPIRSRAVGRPTGGMSGVKGKKAQVEAPKLRVDPRVEASAASFLGELTAIRAAAPCRVHVAADEAIRVDSDSGAVSGTILPLSQSDVPPAFVAVVDSMLGAGQKLSIPAAASSSATGYANAAPSASAALTLLLFESADILFPADGQGMDVGFLAALRDLAQDTRCPIVLTVSKPLLGRAYAALHGLGALRLPFPRPPPSLLAVHLQAVAVAEGCPLSPRGLARILLATQCDMRAALMQMQACGSRLPIAASAGALLPGLVQVAVSDAKLQLARLLEHAAMVVQGQWADTLAASAASSFSTTIDTSGIEMLSTTVDNSADTVNLLVSPDSINVVMRRESSAAPDLNFPVDPIKLPEQDGEVFTYDPPAAILLPSAGEIMQEAMEGKGESAPQVLDEELGVCAASIAVEGSSVQAVFPHDDLVPDGHDMLPTNVPCAKATLAAIVPSPPRGRPRRAAAVAADNRLKALALNSTFIFGEVHVPVTRKRKGSDDDGDYEGKAAEAEARKESRMERKRKREEDAESNVAAGKRKPLSKADQAKAVVAEAAYTASMNLIIEAQDSAMDLLDAVRAARSGPVGDDVDAPPTILVTCPAILPSVSSLELQVDGVTAMSHDHSAGDGSDEPFEDPFGRLRILDIQPSSICGLAATFSGDDAAGTLVLRGTGFRVGAFLSIAGVPVPPDMVRVKSSRKLAVRVTQEFLNQVTSSVLATPEAVDAPLSSSTLIMLPSRQTLASVDRAAGLVEEECITELGDDAVPSVLAAVADSTARVPLVLADVIVTVGHHAVVAGRALALSRETLSSLAAILPVSIQLWGMPTHAGAKARPEVDIFKHVMAYLGKSKARVPARKGSKLARKPSIKKGKKRGLAKYRAGAEEDITPRVGVTVTGVGRLRRVDSACGDSDEDVLGASVRAVSGQLDSLVPQLAPSAKALVTEMHPTSSSPSLPSGSPLVSEEDEEDGAVVVVRASKRPRIANPEEAALASTTILSEVEEDVSEGVRGPIEATVTEMDHVADPWEEDGSQVGSEDYGEDIDLTVKTHTPLVHVDIDTLIGMAQWADRQSYCDVLSVPRGHGGTGVGPLLALPGPAPMHPVLLAWSHPAGRAAGLEEEAGEWQPEDIARARMDQSGSATGVDFGAVLAGGHAVLQPASTVSCLHGLDMNMNCPRVWLGYRCGESEAREWEPEEGEEGAAGDRVGQDTDEDRDAGQMRLAFGSNGGTKKVEHVMLSDDTLVLQAESAATPLTVQDEDTARNFVSSVTACLLGPGARECHERAVVASSAMHRVPRMTAHGHTQGQVHVPLPLAALLDCDIMCGLILAARTAQAVRATALLRVILPATLLQARALCVCSGHAPATRSCQGGSTMGFSERVATVQLIAAAEIENKRRAVEAAAARGSMAGTVTWGGLRRSTRAATRPPSAPASFKSHLGHSLLLDVKGGGWEALLMA